MTALVTEIMTARVIGIGIDSGTGVTEDTIGPADFGLLTDVRTVGPFKTGSVSRIAATEPRTVRRNRRARPALLRRSGGPAAFVIVTLAPLRRGFFLCQPAARHVQATQGRCRSPEGIVALIFYYLGFMAAGDVAEEILRIPSVAADAGGW
jgi:hypothetical protein